VGPDYGTNNRVSGINDAPLGSVVQRGYYTILEFILGGDGRPIEGQRCRFNQLSFSITQVCEQHSGVWTPSLDGGWVRSLDSYV